MKTQRKEVLEVFLKENTLITGSFATELDEQGFTLQAINFAAKDSEFKIIHVYEKQVEEYKVPNIDKSFLPEQGGYTKFLKFQLGLYEKYKNLPLNSSVRAHYHPIIEGLKDTIKAYETPIDESKERDLEVGESTQNKIKAGDVVSLKSNPEHLMVVEAITVAVVPNNVMHAKCTMVNKEGNVQTCTVSETALMLRTNEITK